MENNFRFIKRRCFCEDIKKVEQFTKEEIYNSLDSYSKEKVDKLKKNVDDNLFLIDYVTNHYSERILVNENDKNNFYIPIKVLCKKEKEYVIGNGKLFVHYSNDNYVDKRLNYYHHYISMSNTYPTNVGESVDYWGKENLMRTILENQDNLQRVCDNLNMLNKYYL